MDLSNADLKIALVEFCAKIGYAFQNPELLICAITHPSINYKKPTKKTLEKISESNKRKSTTSEVSLTKSKFGNNYEKLEFLGDKVLSLIMSEFLLEKYSSESEGMISRRHSGLVCGSVLSEVAKRIGLPQILQMSQGERNLGGAYNNHNLENCLEALIAAIYRDGGLAAAKNFVIDSWQSFLQEKDEFRKDPVSCLQEIMQEACKRVPEYLVSREKGLDHAPVFVAKLVFANGIWEKIEETAKKDLQSLRHFTSNFLPNKSFMALCKSTGCIEFLSKGNSKKEAIRNVAVKTLSFFSLN